MANYELVPVNVPTNVAEAEQRERWLEVVSTKGGELVCFMPTNNPNVVLAVFRVTAAYPREQKKPW